jgi:hypothetical protein
MIDHLCLEINRAKNAIVDRNKVSRAICKVVINIFTVGNDAIMEDYVITRNTVINSIEVRFNIGIDPRTDRYYIFRWIHIIKNKVIESKISDYTPTSERRIILSLLLATCLSILRSDAILCGLARQLLRKRR